MLHLIDVRARVKTEHVEMRLLSSPTGSRIPRHAELVIVRECTNERVSMHNSERRRDTIPISSDFTISRFMQICVLSVMLLQRLTLAAFDWNLVKPMYLVSRPQRYMMNETLDRIDNDELIDEHDLIMNSEAESILEDHIPEGLKAMDRIFGGNVATQFCFPYQVGLLLQRPRGLYWCGGSLISDAYVLTAAHCVDKAKRALVFLGAHEIKNAKEVGQVRVMVNQSNFIIFPTWNSRRLKDDIAIVRLPVPIEFNERIHPIQLPKRSYEYRNFRNKLAIASGWGRYSTAVHAISGVLRFVKLRIVDGETCERSFPLSYRSTNICTSGKFAKSTCNGDSGGPLVLQRKHSKDRVLVGITSFGSIFGCDRGYPAAFTKVASYLDWISDETGVESSQWKPDAELFTSYSDKSISSSHLTDTKEFCADLSDDPIESYDEDFNEGSVDNDNDKLLYKHEQRYPDGTLLRTQFYHG